jgi:hypothetical protein
VGFKAMLFLRNTPTFLRNVDGTLEVRSATAQNIILFVIGTLLRTDVMFQRIKNSRFS